jgi:glutathione-specific gamma-glutamylcyclotransferase
MLAAALALRAVYNRTKTMSAIPARKAPSEIPAKDVITRDGLRSGQFMEIVRGLEGVAVQTEEQLEASLSAALQVQPRLGPIWVFGYGSLMWNPAFEFEESVPATLRGWRRRFCIETPIGRGTLDKPGLALALDRGGSTRGVAFRLPPHRERDELELIWRREMFSGFYSAKWLNIEAGGRRFPAMAFVVDRSKASYAGVLNDDVVMERIGSSRGSLGTGFEYLEDMVSHLEGIGVHDRPMQRLYARLSHELSDDFKK